MRGEKVRAHDNDIAFPLFAGLIQMHEKKKASPLSVK